MARSAQDVVGSTIQNDVAPTVNRVWGRMRFLVSLTAMTASLGAFIPIMIGSSRMLYAMAREAKLPRAIASLHRKFQSPWNALHVLFVFTILGTVPAVFLFGTDNTINWWGFTLGWYIAVVYLAANAVNIVYYWRFARGRFNLILNALIPAAAIAVQLVFLWQTVIVELWQNGALGRSAQAYIAVMSIATLIYVLLIRSRSSDRVSGLQVAMSAKETA
jgi:amino acid transporter